MRYSGRESKVKEGRPYPSTATEPPSRRSPSDPGSALSRWSSSSPSRDWTTSGSAGPTRPVIFGSFSSRSRPASPPGRALPTPACVPDPEDARGRGAAAHRSAPAPSLRRREEALGLLSRRHPDGAWRVRSTVCDLFDRHGLVRKSRTRHRVGHPGEPNTATSVLICLLSSPLLHSIVHHSLGAA